MSQSPPVDPPPSLDQLDFPDIAPSVTPLALTADERAAVESVRAAIDDQPQDTFLARVEAEIAADEAAPADRRPPHADVRREALRAWWYFGQGLDAGGARNMDEAVRCYRRATFEFARLGNTGQVEECVAQGVLAQAGARIQAQDIAGSGALLAEARRLLQGSDRFGADQREQLAALEVEALGLQSTQAFQAGNPVLGETLLGKAAERLDALARTHDAADPARQLLSGQAGLLRARAACSAAFRAVGLYSFDSIDSGGSAAAAAAAGLLAERSPANSAMAAFYAELLGVLEQLAALMLRVLGSSFHRDGGEFHRLRERIKAARKVIPAAAGADGVGLSVVCDQLNEWLHNLERLAKPSTKDRVILGGFVACVAFCVLLLVVAGVNRVFTLGANATAIFGVCTTLAVAAGFGVPGIRALRSGGGEKDAG